MHCITSEAFALTLLELPVEKSSRDAGIAFRENVDRSMDGTLCRVRTASRLFFLCNQSYSGLNTFRFTVQAVNYTLLILAYKDADEVIHCGHFYSYWLVSIAIIMRFPKDSSY